MGDGEPSVPQVSPKAKAPSNQCIIHALVAQKSSRPFAKVKGGQALGAAAKGYRRCLSFLSRDPFS